MIIVLGDLKRGEIGINCMSEYQEKGNFLDLKVNNVQTTTKTLEHVVRF